MSDSTDAATRLLLRFVLNTAAVAAGGLIAAFEWTRATRRSDPVSSPRRVHVVDIDQGGDELRAVRTYYEILGVEQTASDAELRAAYRRLLRQAHPDMGGSSALLDLVNEAYDALKDPAKRSQYDATLRQGTSKDESVSTAPGQPPREPPRTSRPHEPPAAPPFGRSENRNSTTRARTTYSGVPRSRSGRVPQWVVDEAPVSYTHLTLPTIYSV